jgi:hypothetical protein
MAQWIHHVVRANHLQPMPAAVHQPICSIYFLTEPFATANRGGRPLPQIRNSEK